MKDLTKLGSYVNGLISAYGSGLNEAAKACGISAAELSSIRDGKRRSPNPVFLEAIADTLKGDYGIMMELAGYRVPDQRNGGILSMPIIERITDPSDVSKFVVGFMDIPLSWFPCEGGYFWYREPSATTIGAARLSFIMQTEEWSDGDVVLVQCPVGVAATRYAFKHEKGVELLSPFGMLERVVLSEFTIIGRALRVVLDYGNAAR